MHTYKQSSYNHKVTLSDGKILLHNFMSGALDEISDHYEQVEYVLNQCNEPMMGNLQEIRAKLIDGRYLIPEDTDEFAIIRTHNLHKRFNNNHKYMVIMPTLECNFACEYCYETKYAGFMPENVQKGIFKWIDHIAEDSKHFGIGWFGGEPLLDFPLIEKINRYAIEVCEANKCAFRSQITTNGYLLNEDMVKKMDKLNIYSFQITLDGIPETHNKLRPLKNGKGTFDIVYANILKLLDQTNAIVRVRVNVDSENYSSVFKLMDMIPDKYKTPKLRFAFLKIFSSPDKNATINKDIEQKRISSSVMMKDLFVYAIKKGFHVQFPLLAVNEQFCETCSENYFIVHPKGDIFKCSIAFELGKRTGYITEEGKIEIDQAMLSKWSSYVIGDDKKCTQCKLLPLCYGGCLFQRFEGYEGCPYEVEDLDGIVELKYYAAIHSKEL